MATSRCAEGLPAGAKALDLLPIDNNFNNAVSQRASRDPIQRVQISTKQL